MAALSPAGRFAPSPSGRMHLGNVLTALASWLSARASGKRWILRIEDLDPQRSKDEYARLIEDDLLWLGLEWDEGGIDGIGEHGPYRQSLRGEIYERVFERLRASGLLYSCRCRRADILATQAPHQSDGRIVYAGTCRPSARPPFSAGLEAGAATRIYAPDEVIEFADRTYGRQRVNLAEHCGDFVLRRGDGAWAYQLAVVADDALMGVTEVVRGSDLLLSSAQQIYLYRLLGYPEPEFAHVPLVCNSSGVRLSKRDASQSMESLRSRFTGPALIGQLAVLLGLISEPEPCTAAALLPLFDWKKLPVAATLRLADAD